jgi:hypothetical protein
MYRFRVLQNTQITASPSPQFYRGIYHSRHSGREEYIEFKIILDVFYSFNVVHTGCLSSLVPMILFKISNPVYDPIRDYRSTVSR